MSAITDLAPIACLVTEHSWERPVRSLARRRHTSDEPVRTETVSYRIAHISNDCPHARDGEIVGIDLPLASRDAGTVCDYCGPSYVPGAGLIETPRAPRPTPSMVGIACQHATPTDGPSEKQVRFWTALMDERGHDATAGRSRMEAQGRWTKRGVSASIEKLLAQPKPAPAVSAPVETPARSRYADEAKRGDVHVIDGVYYRIHIAQKSGNAYAARADVTSPAVWADDGSLAKPGAIRWEYDRGRINRLSAETLATPEEAAAFGHLVGRCCFCSHPIDTPESTAVGYGPICAENYGLPWGV